MLAAIRVNPEPLVNTLTRMRAMANTTPIVDLPVTKTQTKKRRQTRTPGVNNVDSAKNTTKTTCRSLMIRLGRYNEKESGPSRTDSRDPSHSRCHHPKRERPRIEERSWSAEESYGDTYSRETKTKYRDRSRDEDRFRSLKRRKESESLSSRGSESSTSNRGHWKSRTKRRELVDEDDLAIPWTCEDQKKYVKGPVEIHNIKQRPGDTIEDFMERFKVETGRMKGAPKCMRISGFMHGVNNPELTKRLNEQVPKTMKEMMTGPLTAFITEGSRKPGRASKRKGHLLVEITTEPSGHASEQNS
ncbi:hypothetical protein Tco_1501730 [Tanacetum coccineum]